MQTCTVADMLEVLLVHFDPLLLYFFFQCYFDKFPFFQTLNFLNHPIINLIWKHQYQVAVRLLCLYMYEVVL